MWLISIGAEENNLLCMSYQASEEGILLVFGYIMTYKLFVSFLIKWM